MLATLDRGYVGACARDLRHEERCFVARRCLLRLGTPGRSPAAARKGWPHIWSSFRLQVHVAVFGVAARGLTIYLTGYEMPLPLSFKDPPVESAVCEPPLYFPS